MKTLFIFLSLTIWTPLGLAAELDCTPQLTSTPFTRLKTPEGRLFATQTFRLSAATIELLESNLAAYANTSAENPYTEFFFEGFMGLEIDAQGLQHQGVALAKVIPLDLYDSLSSMVQEIIIHAKLKIKGFKPKVALLRRYHKPGVGGMWHRDLGTTYTQSLVGPATIFRLPMADESLGFLFDNRVEHSFPESPNGRILLLIAD